MKSGVYKIVNPQTSTLYIGSSKDLSRRERDHFRQLTNNTHINNHLQHAFNKYGAHNFIFDVLEYCTESELLEREQVYLDAFPNKYNICNTAGDGPHPFKDMSYEDYFGVDRAINIKNKQSTSHKLTNNSGRFKKGITAYNKGKTLEEIHGVEKAKEIRAKISKNTSKAQLGTKRGPYKIKQGNK